MGRVKTALAHAFNAFLDQDPKLALNSRGPFDIGASYGTRPDRLRLRISNDRSIISSIYTRMSIDVASVSMRHVRLDQNGRFESEMHDSGLNRCLSIEANIDQAARAFRQDMVSTLFDKGVCAVVPVDTTENPMTTGGYDIKTMRVGEIVQWYPSHVRVNLYNDRTGRHEEVTLEKKMVAIVENPLYSIMNEPSSTLQRLIRKLNLLDAIDEQSGSGKLDIIIQLPYSIKSDMKRQQAEQRREDMEFQLKGSKYGIAYADANEKITQLNRPAENNLLKQVEYLMEMLFAQLGVTTEVMNGTADEKTMLNYYHRTVEPIVDAFVEEFRRKFLTKTAMSQSQSILTFYDVFKLVPVSDLAEIADKFTRNEILTSNEIRGIIGFKPAKNAKADMLVNSNMPQQVTGVPIPEPARPTPSGSE